MGWSTLCLIWILQESPQTGRVAQLRRRTRGCLSAGGTPVCVNPLAPRTPRWGKTRRSLRCRDVFCLMMKKWRTHLREALRQRRMRAFSEPPPPPRKMALSYRSSEIHPDKRYFFARPSRGRLQFSGRCNWDGRDAAHRSRTALHESHCCRLGLELLLGEASGLTSGWHLGGTSRGGRLIVQKRLECPESGAGFG